MKTTQIEQLVNEELQSARIKFPQPLNSPHEGFAVLLEEIEELDEEMDTLRVIKDVLWYNVRKDNLELQDQTLDEMRLVVQKIIKEAVQVGAMIEKYQQDVLTKFQ